VTSITTGSADSPSSPASVGEAVLAARGQHDLVAVLTKVRAISAPKPADAPVMKTIMMEFP
jgi:hypothetical protein